MMLFVRLSFYCKVFYGQTSAYAFRAGQPENSSHILHCVLFEKLDVAHWLSYAVPMVPPSYTPVGNLMLTRVLSIPFFVHVKTWNISMPGSDNGFLTSASRSSRKKERKKENGVK